MGMCARARAISTQRVAFIVGNRGMCGHRRDEFRH